MNATKEMIDPAVEHTLRIAVERVVRPVRSEEGRKMRMRRELLAHATEAYLHEKATDPILAIDRAVQRLGDPRELTAELQSGVPWHDRWSGWVDRTLLRRARDKPRWRHSLGLAGIGLLEIGSLVVLVEGLHALGVFPRPAFQDGVVLRFFLFLVLMFAVNLFTGSYLGGFVRDELAAKPTPRRGRAVAWASLGSLSLWVSGCLLWTIVAWPGAWWSTQYFVSWTTLSLLYTPVAIGGSLVDIHQRRELEEWLALDLG